MLKSRLITLASASYETRTEMFEEREHLVVPIVALVEGVVHAMNSEEPEFVGAAEFQHHPGGWDGRPIFEGHPIVDGEPVSGNAPEVLGTKRIGTVFNTAASGKKLQMEAWIDVELCAERAPDLLRRLQDGAPIEISVGTFVDTDDSSGMFKGKRYKGAWTGITPDHLALLPEGDVGACSRDAGCGVRAAAGESQPRDEKGRWTDAANTATSAADAASSAANAVNFQKDTQKTADAHADAATAHEKAADAHAKASQEATDALMKDYHDTIASSHRKRADGHTKASGIFATIKVKDASSKESRHMQDFKNLRNIPQSELDKMDVKDYAGPSKSFPIAAPEDIKAASHALGRAKGDRAAIKRKIVEIAYRKGSDYVAQLPDDWKRKGDQPKTALSRVLAAVTGIFRTAQDADEMGSNDLKNRLQEALLGIEDTCAWIDDYFPVTDPSHVVYTCMVPNGEVYGEAPYAYPGYDYVQFERAFGLESDGTLTIQSARVRVRSVSRWEPIEGAQPEADTVTTARVAEQNPATGAPTATSNEAPISGDGSMTKAELITALDGATECQIKALADVLAGKPAPTVASAAAPVVPVVPAVVAPVVAEVKETPAAAVEVTLNDLLAKATPDQRAAFAGITAAAATKKADTITALKATGRNPFSDEQLLEMDQTALDRLVSLAGVQAPKAAIDYSIAGARGTQASNDVAAPPDLGAAIRAARAAKP